MSHEHDRGAGFVECLPESTEVGVALGLARGEARVMPVSEHALLVLVRGEVLPEPPLLGRAGPASPNRVAHAVEDDDVPSADVPRVVAVRGGAALGGPRRPGSGRAAEVIEVPAYAPIGRTAIRARTPEEGRTRGSRSTGGSCLYRSPSCACSSRGTWRGC